MSHGRGGAGDDGRTAAYDAFVSYSHVWDRELAKAFQNALQSFDRPWYRPRSLKLFRDETNLSASPHLWREIEHGLSRSRWLVVMACPSAAVSPWVRQEISWWLTHRSADTLLIGWTDGTLVWDSERTSFDWSLTDALPREEMGPAFTEEPRWVDLRWLRGPEPAGTDPRLIECVAEFVAPLTGRSKDELIGDHVRQRRRTRRWVQGTVAVLTTLLLLAAVGGLTAYQQRNTARAQTLVAQSRQLVAEASTIRDSHPDLARQLMVQAYRLAPTAEAYGALVESRSMPRVIHGRGSVRTVAYSGRGLLAVADDDVRLFDDADGGRPLSRYSPQHRVTQLAFSPDGALLALGGTDGRVRLLDVADAGHPRLLGSSAAVGQAPVVVVVPTPGARLIALTEKGGAVLDIRDPGRPRRLGALPSDAVAASPRGDLIATQEGTAQGELGEPGEQGARVRLWSVSDPARLRQVAVLTAPPWALSSESQRVAFSPDGRTLAVAGGDSRVLLWDVADPDRPVARPELYARSRQGILAVAFSPDATTLAIGDSDGTITLWDVSDLLRPRFGAQLSGHAGAVDNLAFSPDGNTLASADTDELLVPQVDRTTVRLWAVSGSERTSTAAVLPAEGGFLPSFSPDSGLLAAGGEPTTVWRVDETEPPRLLSVLESFNAGGQAAAFGPSGRVLFSGLPVRAWDLSEPEHPRDLAPGTVRTSGAEDLGVNPVLPLVAVGGGPDREVQLWDTSVRTRPALLGTLGGSATQDQSIAFSPDGALLAAPTRKGGVRLWQVGRQARPTPAGDLPEQDGKATALAFSTRDRTLLVGDDTGTITAWDVSRPGRPVREGASTRHIGAIRGLAFSPDGELAATTGLDGRIRLWDVRDPARPMEVVSLSGGGLYPQATVGFSPDGRLLAAGGYAGVRLWTVEQDGILGRLCAESPRITRGQWMQYLPNRPYDPPCA